MFHFYTGIILAIKSYSNAFSIIRKLKIGWVFIIPILILLLNIVLGGNTASYLTGVITEWVREQLPFSLGDSWFAEFIRMLGAFFIWLAIFFMLIYIGGFILLIFLSPVLIYVSDKVDAHLSGETPPFVLGRFLKDIFRGVAIALRNLTIEVVNSLVSIFIGFLPLVGFVVPAYLFVLASYFYGFSFMDYTLERRAYNVKQSIYTVRRNKGTAIGLGVIYMLFTTVPYIGFAFAGFISILSTVAATIATNEIIQKEKQQ